MLMKEGFIICLSLLSGIVAIAQDHPRAYELHRKATLTNPYDSTKNINHVFSKDLPSLVGQSLYFIPNQRNEAEGHYDRLVLTTRLPKSRIEHLSKEFTNVIYKPNTVKIGQYDFYQTYTSYEALKGKAFEIIDFLPKTSELGEYFVLRSPENGEDLYMEYRESSINSPYIVLLGYYENLKSKLVGKKYSPRSDMRIPQFESNHPTPFFVTDTLICVDISFIDDRYNPEIVLLESKYGNIYYYPYQHLRSFFSDVDEAKQWREDEAKKQLAREKEMISKYGKVNGKLIANYEVKIGFTKQMCIDAWGEPKHINTTTTKFGQSEQWVYSDSYLYFDNGKLTAIQD